MTKKNNFHDFVTVGVVPARVEMYPFFRHLKLLRGCSPPTLLAGRHVEPGQMDSRGVRKKPRVTWKKWHEKIIV